MHRPADVREERVCQPAPNLGPQQPLGPHPTSSDVENIIITKDQICSLRAEIDSFMEGLGSVLNTFGDALQGNLACHDVSCSGRTIRLSIGRHDCRVIWSVLNEAGMQIEFRDSLVRHVREFLPTLLNIIAERVGPAEFRKALQDYYNCARE